MNNKTQPPSSVPADAPGVIAFPPLLFLITLAIGVSAHCIYPVPLPHPQTLRIVGALLVVTAGTMVLAARAQMVRAGTNILPHLPSTAIVTGGPYRFTRNPMYLSLCLLNLGAGLLLSDLTPVALTLVLVVVLHLGVIAREERYLERKFGSVYTSYRSHVRRWL